MLRALTQAAQLCTAKTNSHQNKLESTASDLKHPRRIMDIETFSNSHQAIIPRSRRVITPILEKIPF
jgi:hypothetical protein